jgi:8-oxo-dGTP pyrophosphatase MutT (NUDIX family)
MTYRLWVEDEWVEIPVPEMGGEALVVPNVAAIVLNEARDAVLLQRRDKPGEPVRGRLELPGGRWGAGESPDIAVAREVAEETGVEVLALTGPVEHIKSGIHRSCAVARPVAVVNGLDGTYPSLHVLFECVGSGEPRPQAGETADPQWWPLDEVRKLLEEHPDELIDQTRAMLTAYLS